MKKFQNYVCMAAGLAVLAAVVSGIAAGPAIAAAVKAALIKDVDEPGRSPFTANLRCTTAGPSTICNTATPFTVPAGKRAVLQHVSGGALISSGPQIRLISFGCGPTAQVHPDRESTLGGFDQYSVNTPFVEYCEPGSTVSTQMQVTSAVPVLLLELQVTGYLIDLSI